uniref:Uncharacterized protein n=1 Tax=Arundo donax TaxID=35708 RepID=A0A0A9GYP3_ARUDO
MELIARGVAGAAAWAGGHSYPLPIACRAEVWSIQKVPTSVRITSVRTTAMQRSVQVKMNTGQQPFLLTVILYLVKKNVYAFFVYMIYMIKHPFHLEIS